MQQESKVLLSAVLVLGVAMLSSSFLNLTGNSVNCERSVGVAIPSVIDAGESVTIEVSGGEGFYNEARIYKRVVDRNGAIRDFKVGQSEQNACNGPYRCKATDFKIQTLSNEVSALWETNQDYVVKLKDVCTGDFTIEAPFRIR